MNLQTTVLKCLNCWLIQHFNFFVILRPIIKNLHMNGPVLWFLHNLGGKKKSINWDSLIQNTWISFPLPLILCLYKACKVFDYGRKNSFWICSGVFLIKKVTRNQKEKRIHLNIWHTSYCKVFKNSGHIGKKIAIGITMKAVLISDW